VSALAIGVKSTVRLLRLPNIVFWIFRPFLTALFFGIPDPVFSMLRPIDSTQAGMP
jgi:hypothetical protein